MNDEKIVCFVDSNVWLYVLLPKSDEQKIARAKRLFRNDAVEIVISTQVVNEISNNLLRKGKMAEAEVRASIRALYQNYIVVSMSESIQLHASKLREQYQFSHFDGLIVASALAADASILYSEDMHNGLIVENKLKIVNPF